MSDNNHFVSDLLDEIDWFSATEPEPEPDTNLYVIGLDPGGTTGFALLTVPDEGNGKPELTFLHQIEDGLEGFIKFFKGGDHILSNTVIVSEKWKERNIKGADRTPQYIEGFMIGMWEGIVWQTPDFKSLVPDQWLKDNELWTPGKRHQMDALKHAYAYLRNQGNSATVESLAGESDDSMGDQEATDAAQMDGDISDLMEALEAMMGDGEGTEELPSAPGEGESDPTGPGEEHTTDEVPFRESREDNRIKYIPDGKGGFKPDDSGAKTLWSI